MFFNEYPYRNIEDLNLDYILKRIQILDTTTKEFVALNSLKYANPIQWDITSQYEKNTIVIEPRTGVAYISVQAVPSGVAIANTDYWTVVFDLQQLIDAVTNNLSYNTESNTTTATRPYAAGDWVVWDGVLYYALVNMVAGDAFFPDSNIKRLTVEEAINKVISSVDAEVTAREDADTLLQNNINALQANIEAEVAAREAADTLLQNNIDAEVTAREDADTLLQNNIDAETTAREDADTLLQNNIDAETTAREAADADINDRIDNLILESVYYNIVDHGADNTGINDCLSIINDGLASGKIVYVPQGTFIVSGTIHITSGQKIVGYNDGNISGIGSKIIINNSYDDVIAIDSGTQFAGVENLCLDRHESGGSVGGNGLTVNQSTYIRIKNIVSRNHNYGFYLSATGWSQIEDCTAEFNYSHGFMYQNTNISGALQWQTVNCLSQLNDGSGFVVYGIDNTYHVVTTGIFDKIATFANKQFGVSLYGGDVGVNGIRITNSFLGNDRDGEIRILTLGAVGGLIDSCYLEIAGAAGGGRNEDATANDLGYGIYVFANSQDFTINNCHITSCRGDGILSENDTVSVLGCVIKHNGLSGSGVGIRQSAGTMIISNNNIHNNPTASIAFATDTKSLITNNKLNTTPILAGGSTNIIVDNNVIG